MTSGTGEDAGADPKESRMTMTRTITVTDHEVLVRTVEVIDEAPVQEPFTAITGGPATAAYTAAAGALVLVVAFMPAITALFH